MKKILFGISLIICGTIGISALMLVVVISAGELGSINGNSGLFAYLSWYKMTPYFIGFLLMGIIGIIICAVEAYFGKNSK